MTMTLCLARRIALLGLLGVLVAPWPLTAPRAQTASPADLSPMLTLEGEAALRTRLASQMLLVQAWPAPGPLEDASLVPSRIGMAAIVNLDGQVEIWTSGDLVQDATRILLSLPADERTHPARTVRTRESDGLALLACEGPCPPLERGAPDPAPEDACADGRPLTFVVPAGPGGLVLGHTMVAGPEAPPMEALILVPGRLPPGTPLFDPLGRPAAVVLRPQASRTDRVQAAPLAPRPWPAPAAPEPEPEPASADAASPTAPEPEPQPEPAPADAAPNGLSDRPADGVPVMDLR